MEESSGGKQVTHSNFVLINKSQDLGVETWGSGGKFFEQIYYLSVIKY
jgi:hypothetical protein